MNTEADEVRRTGKLGGSVGIIGVPDLLFAAAVVAIAAGWLALAALLI
jgi:hypothetical protein